MSLHSRITIASDEELPGLMDLVALRDSGRLIECLDDGFIGLVDSMGNDAAIVQAARVSYGKGTKTPSTDRALIRYLMRHRHTTPLEMVEMKFIIRVPMDAWRQWIRHRTANVNEYSTRYSLAINSSQETPRDQWRAQSSNNKQGSAGSVTEWPEGYRVEHKPADADRSHDTWAVLRDTKDDPDNPYDLMGVYLEPPTPGLHLTKQEEFHHWQSRKLYEERIAMGVAREQARKDLPLSTYTEAYWKCDLHNILHFLSLRMDSHAQLEIRVFAEAMAKLVQQIVPATWEAFEDYRLNGMYFSGPEVELLKSLVSGCAVHMKVMGKTERREFAAKLERLNKSDWAMSFKDE